MSHTAGRQAHDMKYGIMLTSLYGGDGGNRITYYVTGDGSRRLYCDAMLSAEASSKYILANHHIDEIIVLGSAATYDAGDELVPMALTQGESFYASDIRTLSNYSLLRYRLAQFADKIRIEDQDLNDLLDEDERAAVISYLERCYEQRWRERIGSFDRLFDTLVQDARLRNDMLRGLAAEIEGYRDKPDAYGQWITYYLFGKLGSAGQLSLLEGNEGVTVRFLPTDDEGCLSFAGSLSQMLHGFRNEPGEPVELDLYINIHDDNTYDTFTLMNFMDIVKSFPNANVNIVQVATTSHVPGGIVERISDDTELFGISDLLAGTRAFLAYGKTDLLMDYWEHRQGSNAYIAQVLDAMRTIDAGISLCDIGDIIQGIEQLRALLAQQAGRLGDSLAERYFTVILDGIRSDFGELLQTETPRFIDLVKWTYRKGFWQQTLTLIEARAPKDFVERGIFYYCDAPETREKVLDIFGQAQCDLKSSEKYKLNDVAHYFVKFYGRARMPFSNSATQRSREYVKLRMADLNADDGSILQAFSRVPDRMDLYNLLYAYYHVSDVRNNTNHATNEACGANQRDRSSASVRMDMIIEAVRLFVMSYDKVADRLPEQGEPIITVSADEVSARARTLRNQQQTARH